ncbi:restriction endonuclease subunit S [Arundinibacter roseus]|uniref:Restriction endonuclease subunit S n=1 Tax=Arundinibacter roseus TaxID=2070510 RepID=A0A4R4JWQ4_9BACT|nr:restriction endonuclease subunit S [Arundinibacter roseus]TDB58542.1 restriction endonuclease subunit S [Arundinibacter roseus]
MVENRVVQAEFKETEVGLIPSNWEVKKLGTYLIQNPDYGINAAAVTYNQGLPVYLRITDILENGKYSKANVVSVDSVDSGSYFLNEGDLVFARTGASVGKTYLYDKKDGELVFAGFLIRVRTNQKILLPTYLFFFTQTKYYWNWIAANSMRTGQPGINGKEYKELLIPLPPTLAEQTAIATALNDADALITQLEKLIAKKRAIKQGAMQELLKPKERWEVKRLGEIFESSQSKPSIKSETPVVFLGMEDVSEEGKILNQHIFSYSQVKKGLSFFRKDNVLVAKITPCFENGKGACLDTLKTDLGFGSTEFHVLQINEKSIPRFVFYHTQTKEFRNQLELEMTGTAGQKRVPIKSIINYDISLPSLAEQTQIAQTLSDMDVEIEALEKKLAKYQQLKQGMMQNLLTGKIRLA